jgi:hypothetical protein
LELSNDFFTYHLLFMIQWSHFSPHLYWFWCNLWALVGLCIG